LIAALAIPLTSETLPILIVLTVLLALAEAATLNAYLRERRTRRQNRTPRQRPIGAPPIRAVTADEVDPIFRLGPYGPGVETEVAFVSKGPLGVHGSTSDVEAWILAVLATRARCLFEFGTCTGRTAYLWARNSPSDARVITLTLAPDERSTYRQDATDDAGDTASALSESAYTSFLYSGTPVAAKVEQLFGDSKSLDVSRWAGQCDLVFVDGSHAYSYVKSDSERALALVRPGGLVLWHDYSGPSHSPGVYQALNELAERLPLVRIEGTMLAAYRQPTVS
jgi:predicted O-methyltransferase YrrM